MTLRPASAMWSSEVTPGVLPTTRRRSAGTPSSMSSLITSDELGMTSRCSGAGAGPRSRWPDPRLLFDGASSGVGRRQSRRPRRGVAFASADGADAADALDALDPDRPFRTRVAAGSHGRRLAGRCLGLGRGVPARPGLDRGHRRLELAPGRGRQRRVRGEHLGQHREPLLGALDQLGLELDEAVDDARPGDDVDLVEAQLHSRIAVAHDPLAPELPDGHQLDERRVARQLEHERARVRGRPFDGARRPIRRSLELLAAHGAAGTLGPGQRLDRHDGALAGLAEPDREAGLGQRPVRGVHVAILELRRAQRGRPGERADLLVDEVALGGRQVDDPVLELDLDRALHGLAHARGSSEPAPAPGRWGRGHDAAVGEGVLLHDLERVDRARPALDRLGPDPRGVRSELPRAAVVGQHDVEDLGQAVLRIVVLDRRDRLDPPVEVAVHQVRRADVELALAAVLEAPDPRVLEELADDRADADPLGDAGQPGLDRARAAHDEVDVDAGARRAVERLDDRDVDDRVELEHDPRRASGRGVADLALDEVEEPRAQAVRRDEQASERPLARQPGQDVEQVRDVRAELRSAGQQAEVDVLPRRLGVVVAGPDVDVAAQPGALAPDDERRLGVRLEPDQPVHDVGAGALELARPDDVGLLVEARLDLDQDDDLLAALGGPDERLDDGRVARRPVQRLLDGQDVGVVGRLGDEPLGRTPRTTRTGGGRGCRRRGSRRTRRPARRRRAAGAAAA